MLLPSVRVVVCVPSPALLGICSRPTANGEGDALSAPWSFSEEPDPATAVPNEPTPLGRELGVQLARLVDIEAEKLREKFPDAPGPCNECAGTAGTLPNGCGETLMDLIKCSVEGVPFYCHKAKNPDGSPRVLCHAWSALVGSACGGIPLARIVAKAAARALGTPPTGEP